MGVYRQLGAGCFTGLSTALVNYTQLICPTLIIQAALRNVAGRDAPPSIFMQDLLEAAAKWGGSVVNWRTNGKFEKNEKRKTIQSGTSVHSSGSEAWLAGFVCFR